MRILVHHQGQQLGPFSLDELRAALAAGKVASQDLAWWDGQASWVPVATVPGIGSIAGGGPSPGVAGSSDGSGLAISSLVLGILSLIACAFFSGIPAIICGHMALARKSRAGVTEGKGIAITGLVTGYAGTLLTTLIAIAMVAVSVPALKQAKSGAQSVVTMSQAQIISMALQQYSATHNGAFPATLQDLVDASLIDANSLRDPFAPEFGTDAFRYIAPGPADPPDKIILVSRSKDARGARVVVHKDGSIDREKYTLPADL